MQLIGASGKRILVFQVNDTSSELKLGLTRPEDNEHVAGWDGNADEEDDLDDHLFTKRI